MTIYNNEEMLEIMGKISPQAKTFVKDAFKHNRVAIILNQLGNLILQVEDEEMIIYFGYAKREDEEFLNVVKETINHIESNKEVCFNVYGENKELIKLIQSYPFRLDYLGYHMVLDHTRFEINHPKQRVIPYNKEYIKDLARLFDRAYQEDFYEKSLSRFTKFIDAYHETDEVRLSLWEGKLIGAYILDGNYIRDIVIDPDYQGKGFGKELMKILLNERFQKYDRIYLRVEEENGRAKKLYLNLGFKIISHCAEHTYKK